jgi:hypothetical protein
MERAPWQRVFPQFDQFLDYWGQMRRTGWMGAFDLAPNTPFFLQGLPLSVSFQASRPRSVPATANTAMPSTRADNHENLSRRRRWRCATGGAALLVALGIAALVTSAGAQQPTTATPTTRILRPGERLSLYDQLRIGLKAVTKADMEFIDRVVLRVNEGVLPRKLVDAVFLWARNRYKTRPSQSRLRPIVYFQPALEAQAKKLGVTI